LYAFIGEYYAIPEHDMRQDYWDGHGNFEDWMGLSRQAYRDAKLAFRQGGYKRYSPPWKGLDLLRDRITELRDQGKVEVWITTTRPWLRMDNVDPDTKFWLGNNFPCYDHLLFGENKYEDLSKIVDPKRVVAILEDLPEKYIEACKFFGNYAPIMIERFHNEWWLDNGRTYDGTPPHSVAGLRAAAMIIEERIEKWHKANATGK
jgi:hypothetical protein